MNTTIKIPAIIALLTGCAASAVLGDTRTWDLDSTNGDGISWSDPLNWTPEVKPVAGDTAILPFRESATYTGRISSADEECEIIQVAFGGKIAEFCA